MAQSVVVIRIDVVTSFVGKACAVSPIAGKLAGAFTGTTHKPEPSIVHGPDNLAARLIVYTALVGPMGILSGSPIIVDEPVPEQVKRPCFRHLA